MSDPHQYDCLLGGTQELPQVLHITKHAISRYKEIKALEQAIQNEAGTKLVFQRLPRHMRRRAMSYNVKRLPRLLRNKYASQLQKSGVPPASKRPTRKYRRRPYNLTANHLLRQARIRWLETHIWHAKRFHMVNRWGYRLPYAPCDKAFRACYRATTQHCLVQDISYLACVELTGPRDQLMSGLKRVCEPDFGLGLTAKAFIRGTREGSTILLDFHTRKAIGPVTFMWKPENQMKDEMSLWIWSHPAFSPAVATNLIHCFSLEKVDGSDVLHRNEELRLKMRQKTDVSRFRLTGPLANSILHNALHPFNSDKTESVWLKNYLDTQNSSSLEEQSNFWNQIANVPATTVISPHTILSLIVNDPRLYFPRVRSKATLTTDVGNQVDLIAPNSAAFSPLWDEGCYKEIKDSKISNQKLNEIRSVALVPDEKCDFLHIPVPVILIQRPGNRTYNKGYGNGWDLIVPSGWGQSFWLSLIMWGGRAGGLRETESMEFESGSAPLLMPDTAAGTVEEKRQTDVEEEKFFRLPPNKRTNYTKLGVVEPFSFKWEAILNHWGINGVIKDVDFSVVRNTRILAALQQLLLKQPTATIVNFDEYALVTVRLKVTNGSINRFAMIALPELSDLTTPSPPIEPLRNDPNEKLRKELRTEYRTLIKRHKQRRKRAKLREKAHSEDYAQLLIIREKMKSLWFPRTTSECKTQCCRQIMGFVTKGDFSYTQGYCCATGFVALKSLQSLVNAKSNKILVRNCSSRHYHFATLEVVL